MKKTREERFWAKVDKSGPNGCWLWTSTRLPKGYGVISINGKTQYAHRISWELHNGLIPNHDSPHGMCVLHKCDNPSCVNPAHLFLGSNADNMRDRDEKGRAADQSGEKNNFAKLTEDKVRLIKRFLALPKGRFTQATIGKLFGVTRQAISSINTGNRWTHV